MNVIFGEFLTAGQAALNLISRAVLPVLFPFFVITSFLLQVLPVKHRWVIAGLAYFSGYPNGTRLTKTLYKQGNLTTQQAQHLTILTSTPSPMFVIATVGTIFLKNTLIGIIIFLCAVLGAMINAWLWCPTTQPLTIKTLPHQTTNPNLLKAFNEAISSSVTAIINVCGIVLFFYIFTNLLHLPVFFAGLLEMTTGTAQTVNPLLIEFFVCFGGLSVAMQNMLFAESFQLKMKVYLTYKLTHALLACALLTLILWLL